MKDFDATRRAAILPASERTFKLGGEVFLLKAVVHPSVLVAFDETDGDKPQESVELIDGLVEKLLAPPGPEKWRRIRAVEAEPDDTTDGAYTVGLLELGEVVEWMIGVLTQRPTERPSVSSDGPAPSGTLSTVVSDSSEPTPAISTSAAS